MFDLKAFQTNRDEKRAKGELWKVATSDLLSAYDAGERDLRGADLSGANLRDVNLYGAILRDVNLYGANLYGTDLYGADLYGADLSGADLSGANLYGTDLYGADLSGADLSGAILRGANLSGSNLSEANGIKIISPVGIHGRLIFAYIYEGKIRIQAGYRNDTPTDIRKAVKNDYKKDGDGYADYMDAILLLEKWGKRKLKRAANESA